MSPFEPSPLLLALIVFKSFVYLECLALLALTRGLFGRGPSRLAALVTLALAALGILESIAPLYAAAHASLLPTLSRFLAWQQGAPALLLASLPLALSAVLPGRRFRAIDILHMILLAALLGLWLAARFV
ncbi:hypothetical protein [Salipiger mangrovisoli]|uniref:Uncharacterized protein n=1 Tax=Salipiger mangrovisoli TaxID=2865933 RepID=A0ABR9WYV5_9RHOB|nr:hypothetical protein [Salipiger mangrovisoli]MBE9636431.1 hypothetical protein [Salipiger mangrovisoli]